MTVFFTSDLHFGHNRSFIYEARGFDSIEQHDKTIFDRICETVSPEDELYILGDAILGNNTGIEYIAAIPCNVHIIIGNHDTDNRCELYRECDNVVEITYATIFKYRKWRFYLSHYPTITGNMDDCEKGLRNRLWNLSGHTHSSDKFENMKFNCYNVSIDAHGYPVDIEDIKNDIRKFYNVF